MTTRSTLYLLIWWDTFGALWFIYYCHNAPHIQISVSCNLFIYQACCLLCTQKHVMLDLYLSRFFLCHQEFILTWYDMVMSYGECLSQNSLHMQTVFTKSSPNLYSLRYAPLYTQNTHGQWTGQVKTKNVFHQRTIFVSSIILGSPGIWGRMSIVLVTQR